MDISAPRDCDERGDGADGASGREHFHVARLHIRLPERGHAEAGLLPELTLGLLQSAALLPNLRRTEYEQF